LFDEIDLFIALAEIAGVFVGFGALISLTRRGETDSQELEYMRGVVSIGLVVITAALVPIALTRFGIVDRALWLTSSLTFLSLIFTVFIVSLRAAESKEELVASVRNISKIVIVVILILELSIQVPLILVLLDVFPAMASALYTMALIVNLLQAALVLAVVVFHKPIATTT
jgi:hypothetical protein